MTTEPEGYLLTGQAVQKTAKAVRRLLGSPVNPPPNRGSGPPRFDPHSWHQFINDSEETVPSYAVLELLDDFTVVEVGPDKLDFIYHAGKPGSELQRRYGFNSAKPVEPGGVGLFTFEGPRQIAHHDGWSPVRGDSGGPKPDSWLLHPDYPCLCHVDGVWDADNSVLIGSVEQITTLLCKATADLSAGAVSSNYQIWSGSMASGSNAGFTSLPTIELKYEIASGDFFFADIRNGLWMSESSSDVDCDEEEE